MIQIHTRSLQPVFSGHWKSFFLLSSGWSSGGIKHQHKIKAGWNWSEGKKKTELHPAAIVKPACDCNLCASLWDTCLEKKTFLLEVFWHLLRNSACSQLLKLPCYIMENTRSTCFYHKLTLISGNISTSSKDWMLLWALMVRNDFLEMFWFNLISLSRRVKYSFLSEAADRCDLSASESDMCYICFPGQASKVTPKAT